MKRRVLIPIVIALLLIAALTPAAFAAPSFDTIIESDEVVNNDVVVFDGDLEIHSGAVVNGDVAVFNGDALIDGEVNGSVTMFNGDLVAGPGAAVSGECVLLNGELTGADNRSLGRCTAIENFELGPLGEMAPHWLEDLPGVPPIKPFEARPPVAPVMPEAPAIPAVPIVPGIPGGRERQFDHDDGMGAMARVAGIFASSLMFGFLGLLTGAIMPNQLRQIVHTAREKSLVSGAAGALTAVAVPSLIVLLIPLSILLTFVCIGLLGFPIMFLLALGLVVGGFLGWIAVGTWLGVRLFGRGKDDHIVRSAALGTGLLTFIVGLLGLMPIFVFGGALLSFVVACIGLGAVALTQFGMKPYPRRPQTGEPGDGPDADKVEMVLGTLPPEEAAA